FAPISAADKNVPDDKFFKNFQAGFLSNFPGAKVTDEKAYSFDGNPGKEIVAVVSVQGQQMQLDMRMFRVGDRVYSLNYSGPVAKVNEKDRQRFFDSFKLLKK